MSTIRPELVASAVTFLRDQSVGNSPLAKRIAFLEAKGLSQSEIDEALRQAASNSLPNYAGPRYAPAAQQGRDWRDWFIMTVVGGSVGYLMVALARRYLLPALQPPTESQLTEAQHALTAKYDEAEAILKGLQTETEAVKATLAEQGQKVDKGLEDLRKAIEELRESERKRDELVNGCREEVETIRDLLPRMVEKQQDAQTSALGDLQQELKSLKSILLSRRAAATAATPSNGSGTTTNNMNGALNSRAVNGDSSTSSSTTAQSSPFANLTSRPAGIPAWQLASASTPSKDDATAATSAPAPPKSPEPTASAVNGAQVNGDR